jgi:RNA polymerase sigma factor (sigma-70 family)
MDNGDPSVDSVPTGPITRELRKAKSGDHNATAELFRLVREGLERRAHDLLRQFHAVATRVQADDIVSELWPALERALLPCDPRNGKEFFAVANRKMRCLLIDLSRRLEYKQVRLCDGPEVKATSPGPFTWVAATETMQVLLTAMEHLDDDERQVVEMCYFLDMRTLDIAQQLGISEKTVDRRLKKARERLRVLCKSLAWPKDAPK